MGEINNLNISQSTSKGATAQRTYSSVNLIALSDGSKTRVIQRDSKPFLIGRNNRCDLRIGSKYASRIHAYIEDREDGFYLVDMSSHGTYVNSNKWGPSHLKTADMLLEGSGTISLGVEISSDDSALLHYKIK